MTLVSTAKLRCSLCAGTVGNIVGIFELLRISVCELQVRMEQAGGRTD